MEITLLIFTVGFFSINWYSLMYLVAIIVVYFLLTYRLKKKEASYEKNLTGMIELGADYLVLANPVPSDFDFAKEYLIVEKTPEYVIFDLHKNP